MDAHNWIQQIEDKCAQPNPNKWDHGEEVPMWSKQDICQV